MLKITRVSEAGVTRVIVSGRIAAPQLRDLRRLIEAERASDVVLDLTEVSLVDVDVVQFLLLCEVQGVRLVGCPAYVREWMVREARSQ
jgi:anti-anti-sigma regulatory factor